MSTATPRLSGPVNLHTEAQSIRDWSSVCDHVVKRSSSVISETDAFLKLFLALTETYRQYRDMCDKMRNVITTQKEYVEVPDYHETAIHQGCDLVQHCLNVMFDCYNELHQRLQAICNEITQKQQEWSVLVAEIIPLTENTKAVYLEKENSLQHTMQVYMQAAEHNDRGFFIVAREYQKQLLQFQTTLKQSTDAMQDIIQRVQNVENLKRQFDTNIEKEFIEKVLSQQNLIQNVFKDSLQQLEGLSGKNAWNILTDKLGLYKEDGKTTIFEDPIPNKAGALIKLWMERDMEMTADVRMNSQPGTMFMIVTRWGFVQIYANAKDISPKCEFYIYDYKIQSNTDTGNFDVENAHGLTLKLQVRQHQTFAPLKGITPSYSITFEGQDAMKKFVSLITEFQVTHAPQT